MPSKVENIVDLMWKSMRKAEAEEEVEETNPLKIT